MLIQAYNMYQPRYKTQASGRKIKLCSGKENKCMKEAKAGGTCTGCKTGFDRTVFDKRTEGEIFTDGRGIRYMYIGGQSRQLCIGDNMTCKSLREDATNLCRGHKTGFKKYRGVIRSKGDIVPYGGGLRVYDGIQLVQFCTEENCKIPRVKDGKCKKHSPHWRCKFADGLCENIRINQTEYCTIHRNGVLNPRKKSEGEFRIAAHLDSLGITYTSNQYVKHDDQVMFLDFDIASLNAVIEFDGEQHFNAIEYWGGQESLEDQQIRDFKKDEWIRSTGKYLLRIPYIDVGSVENIVDIYINAIPDLENGAIVATEFQGYVGRGYNIVE